MICLTAIYRMKPSVSCHRLSLLIQWHGKKVVLGKLVKCDMGGVGFKKCYFVSDVLFESPIYQFYLKLVFAGEQVCK